MIENQVPRRIFERLRRFLAARFSMISYVYITNPDPAA